MTSLFKNLMGSGNRESADELRTALHEMQQERARDERLLASIHSAVERLEELGGPIANAVKEVDEMASRYSKLEQRFESIEAMSQRLLTLDERARDLTEGQQRVQGQVVSALEEANQIRAGFDDMRTKISAAHELKGELEGFLEIEKPFQEIQSEAELIRTQVSGTGEHMARMREQSDRIMDAHKLAMSKMEALDRRRDELSRDLQDKERRVARVEEGARAVDSIQTALNEARREMAALKATADLAAQKTAALESQREAMDRILGQAEHLERAMKLIDAGVRQQQENERSLNALNDKIHGLSALHEQVQDRSGEITQLQHELDDRTQAARQDLVAVSDESKRAI